MVTSPPVIHSKVYCKASSKPACALLRFSNTAQASLCCSCSPELLQSVQTIKGIYIQPLMKDRIPRAFAENSKYATSTLSALHNSRVFTGCQGLLPGGGAHTEAAQAVT